ncbi:MAG: PIN domain-containing protein [Candidatus Daviesbacteria bacterium]|nr:PIN domain-containing protein [Candidatus Daviesbacteria bacterium]
MFKKVFVDSDVIVSSLISSLGAAYFLLNQARGLEFFISNISQKELIGVADRLKIDQAKLEKLFQKRFKKVFIKEKLEEIELNYSEYTIDPDDAHIIAGASKSKASFLISYNIRHFKTDKIKKDFNIAVMTPASFLQYLRSVD